MKLKRKEPLIIVVITVINNKRQPLFLKMIFENKILNVLKLIKLLFCFFFLHIFVGFINLNIIKN